MGNGPLLIVGLDFGTTYSGIAWALQGCPDDIEVISTWPGSGNKTAPKVPTVVSYDKHKFQWGYQTSSFGEVIRGVKLLLDETQDTQYTPAIQSKEILKKHDKKPVDVAGDYLQRLVAHAKEVLSRRFGNAMKSIEYQFILTVTAVWSDKAKNTTLTAATKADISALDVSLVSQDRPPYTYNKQESRLIET